MVTDVDLLELPDLTELQFSLWGWMKNKVYERNVEVRNELLSRILNAAARIKKHEDQLRRTAHSLRTPDSKCVKVEVGF
jgi:hypothetical protein